MKLISLTYRIIKLLIIYLPTKISCVRVFVISNFAAVLKDVPNSPYELLKNPDMDPVRMGLFPSLDYKGLYNSLIPLIEVAPLIQYGLHGIFFGFLVF